MTKLYVCQWELSIVDTDEDGEDFNTSDFHDFTTHENFEEATSLAEGGNEAYSKLKCIEYRWEPIYCITVLEYDNNELVAKYQKMDMEGWRYYPKMEHWGNYWPHLMHYPPFNN